MTTFSMPLVIAIAVAAFVAGYVLAFAAAVVMP
jgi:hypothetical protein